jgi:hypothetical protein
MAKDSFHKTYSYSALAAIGARHPHIVVVAHDLLDIGAARVCGCSFSAQRRIKKRLATIISGVGTVLAVLASYELLLCSTIG